MSSYDFVRPHQHVGRNRHADLLRRLKIDDEFELRRLLYREIGGLRALKILSTYVAARRSKSFKLTP